MEEYFNKPAILHKLIELLGNNFSYEEIILIGKRIANDFNITIPGNRYGRLRLQPHIAAEHLVNNFKNINKTREVVGYLIDLDCCSLNGRNIKLKGVEELLVSLRRVGIGFDYKSREFYLIEEREGIPEWEETLKEDKEYDFSFVSVDIVKSSELSKNKDMYIIEQIYNALFEIIRATAHKNGGSVWSWQGDGGIISFWGRQYILDSLYFSIEVLGLLPLFNAKENNIVNYINLRFGIDCGKALFKKNKGNIIASSINCASHLEKRYTEINTISISERVYNSLGDKQKKYFKEGGLIEKEPYFSYSPVAFYQANDDNFISKKLKKKERIKSSKKWLFTRQ